MEHLYEPAEFVGTWHFDYKVSKRQKKKFGLVNVFDDGIRTYFEFAQGAEVPAIFVSGENGDRLVATVPPLEIGGYVQALRVSNKWVLRRGKNTLKITRNR